MPRLILILAALLAGATHALPPVPVAIQPAGAAPALAPLAEREASPTAQRTHLHQRLESLRRSASPRDWALASQMGEMGETDATRLARGTLMRKAAMAAPKDRLVQAYWANASPDISGCDAKHPCADRVSAWANLEPDNGAAWVSVINAALQANDISGSDAALAHMAAATHYDELFVEAVMAWADVYRRYPEPLARQLDTAHPEASDAESIRYTAAFAHAAASSIPAYTLSLRACDRVRNPHASAAHFENCGRIGRLMLTRGSTDSAREFGRAFLRLSGAASADDLTAARIFDWQRQQQQHLDHLSFLENNPVAINAYFKDLKETGSEIEAQRRQLRRAGISLTPPANWQPTRNGKPISPLSVSPAPQSISDATHTQ